MNEKVIIHIDNDLELGFMEVDPYDGLYDDENAEYTLGHDGVLEKMEASMPAEASLVGYLDTDIDGFCMSWAQKEHFYIMPWTTTDAFEWIIFRICWDDNWGKWEWASGARVSGIKNETEAAKYAISQLFEHWGFDVEKEDYLAYAEFLNEL